MNIPGDKGHPWRLKKFVEYQHAVPPIEPATYLAWAKKHKLIQDDCIQLAWYVSMTYCTPTALIMFEHLPRESVTMSSIVQFWENFRPDLIFLSARRYVKNMNWFVPLLRFFMEQTKRTPSRWISQFGLGNANPQANYDLLYQELMRWPFMGRFSVELFTDAMVQMSREGLIVRKFEAPGFNWRDGANITSGTLNMFYEDGAADEFDQSKRLIEFGRYPLSQVEWLDHCLVDIQNAIKTVHPKQDTSISVVTPKICSWRNLFKGTRYAGYHHDRMLETLLKYQAKFPDNYLWTRLFELRKEVFHPALLGELGGWNGIRKERKKLWLEKGLTGAEDIVSGKKLGIPLGRFF